MAQQTRDPKKICSRIGLALFAMLLVWYLSMYGISWLMNTTAPQWLDNEWILWILNSGTLYLFGFPVFLLLMYLIPDGPQPPRWLLKFGPKQFALTMVFCLGISYVINFAAGLLIVVLQQILGGSGVSAVNELLGEGSLPASFLFGVLVPAVGEEFIFRYMIRRKMRGCSDLQYILFSGLCFGLFHANLPQTLFTFAAGSLFAWAYLMTNKIWVPIGMHFIVNSISIVLLPYALGNRPAAVFFFVLIVGFVAGSIILFAGYKNWFFGTLQPPAESGWPYRPWVPRLRTADGARYTRWYDNYARAGTAHWRQRPAVSASYAPIYDPQYLVGQPYQGSLQTAPVPPWMPYGAPVFSGESPVKISLGNLGMVLFMCASGLLLLINLFLMVLP